MHHFQLSAKSRFVITLSKIQSRCVLTNIVVQQVSALFIGLSIGAALSAHHFYPFTWPFYRLWSPVKSFYWFLMHFLHGFLNCSRVWCTNAFWTSVLTFITKKQFLGIICWIGFDFSYKHNELLIFRDPGYPLTSNWKPQRSMISKDVFPPN